MKTRIRIYALPLVMVATLATITGCATHDKSPPSSRWMNPCRDEAAQMLTHRNPSRW